MDEVREWEGEEDKEQDETEEEETTPWRLRDAEKACRARGGSI